MSEDTWCPENDAAYRAELAAMHKHTTQEKLHRALDRIERLEAQLAAAENLYRATEFLAENDPDEVVCDGGGTAILVGLSGIRKALTAYREARK